MKMKVTTTTTLSFLLLFFQALDVLGFTTMVPARTLSLSTQLCMFGGSGAGTPTEDDPEAEAANEQAAGAMGLSAEEYKLAMRAREQLEEAMASKIVTTGNADTILVERDVYNPPKKFEVTITDAAKALGREAVSKELVNVLKKGSEAAAQGRKEAQQEMLKWVQSQS